MPRTAKAPEPTAETPERTAEDKLAAIVAIVRSTDEHRNREKREAWEAIKTELGITPAPADEVGPVAEDAPPDAGDPASSDGTGDAEKSSEGSSRSW